MLGSSIELSKPRSTYTSTISISGDKYSSIVFIIAYVYCGVTLSVVLVVALALVAEQVAVYLNLLRIAHLLALDIREFYA